MNLQQNISTDTAWHAPSAAQVGALIARHEQPLSRPVEVEARQEVPIDELNFRHLKTLREIAAIKYLRNELNLPESAMADPQFHALEKKETKQAWWARSPSVTH